jgi:hypothetical protein
MASKNLKEIKSNVIYPTFITIAFVCEHTDYLITALAKSI